MSKADVVSLLKLRPLGALTQFAKSAFVLYFAHLCCALRTGHA